MFLNKQADSGGCVLLLFGDHLCLYLSDPAVNVIAGLLVQHWSVIIKQFGSLRLGHLLELGPLVLNFLDAWVHCITKRWLQLF